MEKGRRATTPIMEASQGSCESYICSFTGIAKILQVIIGIVVCCCAGIYCQQAAGSNWCSTNPAVVKAYGQVYVILVGVLGLVISTTFFCLQAFRCCPGFSWTSMVCDSASPTKAEEASLALQELITLCFVVPAYLAAAILETWYAAQYDFYTWRDTWSAAAAFAFINTVIYAADVLFICSYRRGRDTDRRRDVRGRPHATWMQVGQTRPGYVQGPPAPGHPHHQHSMQPVQPYTPQQSQISYFSYPQEPRQDYQYQWSRPPSQGPQLGYSQAGTPLGPPPQQGLTQMPPMSSV